LLVARDDFPRPARPAFVERSEVLDYIQQPIVRQRAVQQDLGINAPLVPLVIPLPFDEMIPFTCNRAIAGAVAVADDQEGIVMESVSDDILVEIVAQIAVEPGADVFVDGLQLMKISGSPLTKQTISARRL
jgi:hypothetical protein